MRGDVSGPVGPIVVIGNDLTTLGTIVLSPVKIEAAVGIPTRARLAEESVGVIKGIARFH